MAGNGGARKGAGRKPGIPNKVNIERAILAEQITNESRKRGAKLGREVMEEFMHLFAGMAAAYQPLPPGMTATDGRKPDEVKFLTYAKLAVDVAKDVAEYQSPKLSRIMVHQAPTAPIEQPAANAMTSQLTPQQAYRLLRDADVIDMATAPAAQAAKAKKAASG